MATPIHLAALRSCDSAHQAGARIGACRVATGSAVEPERAAVARLSIGDAVSLVRRMAADDPDCLPSARRFAGLGGRCADYLEGPARSVQGVALGLLVRNRVV